MSKNALIGTGALLAGLAGASAVYGISEMEEAYRIHDDNKARTAEANRHYRNSDMAGGASLAFSISGLIVVVSLIPEMVRPDTETTAEPASAAQPATV